MKRCTLLLMLLLGETIYAQQQTITRLNGSTISFDQIDQTVQALMGKAKVTGMAISIINNKQIAYTKAYGFKHIKDKTLLDTTTVFCAASLSKAVFAYINLILVQDGVLNLDKPLYEYLNKPLPEYEKYADLKEDDRWKLITARQCLSHTTGLPNWWFLNARTGAFDSTGKLAFYFAPGTRYAYSGEGLSLLQMVIEKITGKSLEVLAEEKIFNPIGLKRSSYIWQSRFENDFAYGHTETEEVLGKKKRKKPGAAGSLETTISDYAHFVAYIMNSKGLDTAIWNEMIRPQVQIYSHYQFPTIMDSIYNYNRDIQLGYGLGWGLFNCKYGRAFFKEGHDDDGWLHYNVNFIDKGISLIIMTNSLNGEKIFKPLLEELIADKYSPWKWERYWPLGYIMQ